MMNHIALVGFVFIYFWSENLIQEHFQENLEALMSNSASACTTPSVTSLTYQGRLSKGTSRVQEHGDLLKVKGLVLLCP